MHARSWKGEEGWLGVAGSRTEPLAQFPAVEWGERGKTGAPGVKESALGMASRCTRVADNIPGPRKGEEGLA